MSGNRKRRDLWTAAEEAIARRMWVELTGYSKIERGTIIGKEIGRTAHAVERKFRDLGGGEGLMRGEPRKSLPGAVDVFAERDRVMVQDTRPAHERLMGDPPPGRSALDRYTPPAPPKHRAWADAFSDKNIRLGGGR